MADYFGCRINTAVDWMQKAVPKREGGKEKPLLTWAGVPKGLEFEN
jgi:hypothetical protein